MWTVTRQTDQEADKLRALREDQREAQAILSQAPKMSSAEAIANFNHRQAHARRR